MQTLFNSVGVALITPFNDDLSVDDKSLQNLTEYLIENKVSFLVALGTTSEAPTLSIEEKEKVLQIISEVNNKRLPLVVGIGGNNTKKVVEEINYFSSKYEFDAVLSVCPYYNKPNQRGLVSHFSEIAKNTNKKIIIYNVPGRTSSDILPESVLALVEKFQNIVAIKEASGKIDRGMDIKQNVKREDFSILSGDDALYLAELSVGYDGVISVIANAYPYEFENMTKKILAGNLTEAMEIHYKLYPLIKLIFKEGNPTGIKALLKLKGIIKTNNVRLPLVKASDNLIEEIKKHIY